MHIMQYMNTLPQYTSHKNTACPYWEYQLNYWYGNEHDHIVLA